METQANGLRELSDEGSRDPWAGKIVGYALEKVLAPAHELAGLERTVRI
jgi:hypothetical protein